MIKSAVTKIEIWPRVGILEDDLNLIDQRVDLAKQKNLPIPVEDIALFRARMEQAKKILERMECLNN